MLTRDKARGNDPVAAAVAALQDVETFMNLRRVLGDMGGWKRAGHERVSFRVDTPRGVWGRDTVDQYLMFDCEFEEATHVSIKEIVVKQKSGQLPKTTTRFVCTVYNDRDENQYDRQYSSATPSPFWEEAFRQAGFDWHARHNVYESSGHFQLVKQ